MLFHSLGVLILLVDYAVQQEGGNVSPGLIAGEAAEGGGEDQTTWNFNNKGLDNVPGKPVLDDVYVLANLGGDAGKNIAAAVDDRKPPAVVVAQDVVQGCHVDNPSRAPTPSRFRRRERSSDNPLICPAQSPPISQQEEENPSSESVSQSSEEKPDPWQFEIQERRRLIPQFQHNPGICSEKDHGYQRLIPVCDSGIDFFRTYNFISADWNVRDVRPCRSKPRLISLPV